MYSISWLDLLSRLVRHVCIFFSYVMAANISLAFFSFSLEINATGFNYQNEDEKVTLSFPSALQKGKLKDSPLTRMATGLRVLMNPPLSAINYSSWCFMPCLFVCSWQKQTSYCRKGWINTCWLFCTCFPGSGTLKIDFVGELNDKMKGFYRSKYATPAGEIRYAAVTQFEVQ